jgi:hypothetical protein
VRAASLFGAVATLSIACGLGCIDLSLVGSTSGTGGSGAVGGSWVSGGNGGAAGEDGAAGIQGAAGAAAAACNAGGAKQDLGASCGCASDCDSGFCVEGVCCGSACTNGCQTCTAKGLPGICVARPAGVSPRDTVDCPVDSPSTCGLDGTCDGAGSCRLYLGNTCVGGTCDGDAVVGAYVCDGMGTCRPGATVAICAPFTCDPTRGACTDHCTSDADCAAGGTCDLPAGSCGVTTAGEPCHSDTECLSGHCADGVCCNVACAGPCLACNLLGAVGTCSPVDAGRADPRGICTDNGAASCGHDGICDGGGSCANYPQGTECLAPSCVGNRLNTMGTCDGLGTCGAPGVLDCQPFRCGDGACLASCQSAADCDTPAACVNGSCGLKPVGLACQSASECASSYCVDGVCCDSACSGLCSYCALPGSPGQCTTVAADNPDPRGACTDKGAASCGTNGKCDGNGACETYVLGTVCAAATCAGGAYTPLSTCGGAGQCVTPAPLSCAPYLCDGAQCASACTNDTQCVAPAVCGANSCGFKGAGASCTSAADCQSGFCEQGICCQTACAGACHSCAISNALGTCTNVPIGALDLSGQCQNQGSSSCGTNGRCDGNGACQLVGGVSCPTN